MLPHIAPILLHKIVLLNKKKIFWGCLPCNPRFYFTRFWGWLISTWAKLEVRSSFDGHRIKVWKCNLLGFGFSSLKCWMKILQMSQYPNSAAQWKGVSHPRLSFGHLSSIFSIRSLHNWKWPIWTAKWSGVRPNSFLWLISSALLIMYLVISIKWKVKKYQLVQNLTIRG